MVLPACEVIYLFIMKIVQKFTMRLKKKKMYKKIHAKAMKHIKHLPNFSALSDCLGKWSWKSVISQTQKLRPSFKVRVSFGLCSLIPDSHRQTRRNTTVLSRLRRVGRCELDNYSERVQAAADCHRLSSHRPRRWRKDSFVASGLAV